MKWTDRQTSLERYGFVVDTESYAGNFERELVAYMTGEIGVCEVGKKIAAIAKKELWAHEEGKRTRRWLKRNVIQIADEHGNH